MDAIIETKLSGARSRMRTVLAACGIAWTFSALAVAFVLSFHIDRWIVLTTAGRVGWLLAFALSGIGALGGLVVWPLLRPIADADLAASVEAHYPALGERLLTTVELAHAGAGPGVSTAMVTSLAVETARTSGQLDFAGAIPLDRTKRPAAVTLLALVVLFLHMLLWPGGLSTWFRRLLFPSADIPVYATTHVWVTPADIVVPRGSDVEIGVRTTGRIADRTTLHYRFEGAKWARLDLARPAPGAVGDPDERRFSTRFADLQQSLAYYATANDGRANAHTVRVEERPAVVKVRLAMTYPAYTGRRPETIQATAANVVAPVGSHAEVTIWANKPLRQALMAQPGGATRAWTVDGEQASAQFSIDNDTSYTLRLTDRNGFEAQPPPEYTIRAQADQTPIVQILKPNADLERGQNGYIDIKATATDDYGVRDMRIGYHVAKRAGSLPLPFAANSHPTSANAAARVNLGGLRLNAGDTLVYEARATDGDTVPGPNTGKSASYQIHIVGDREMRDRLDSQATQELDALRRLVKMQKEAQQQVAQARAGRTEMKKQAEQTQRQIAREAADAGQRMATTTQQMHENGVVTPAEAARRDAVQTALQQLARAEMPRAAQEIRQGALPQAAEHQQEIRRELESLLRQIGPPADPAQLAREADRLAQEQQRLADQSRVAAEPLDGRSGPQAAAEARRQVADVARRQGNIREQTRNLQAEVEQAAREAAERGRPESTDLSRASQNMHAANIPAKQAAAQSDLARTQPLTAAARQESAAADLRRLADSLTQAARTAESSNALEQRADRLEKLADRLQQMAEQQRRAVNSMQQNPDAAGAMKIAQQEAGLREDLHKLDPQIAEAPGAMDPAQKASQDLSQAGEQLNRANSQAAVPPGREATRRLLEAASEAQSAARETRLQQDAQEARHELTQLAQDQRALERRTQQAERAGTTSAGTPESRKQMQTLAEDQQKLRQRSGRIEQDISPQEFRYALYEVDRHMDNANRNLWQQKPGPETQAEQEHAAQTLDRIARAMEEQAHGAQHEASGADTQPTADGSPSEALGQIQLAREMQAQIRQETASLDRDRERMPDRNLSDDQQRELNYLGQAQRRTQEMTNRIARQLQAQPEVGQKVQSAAHEMESVVGQLSNRQTGQPTQEHQETIVKTLDDAIAQARQNMREEQRQMARRMQSRNSQMAQRQFQPSSQPAQRATPPVVQAQPGAFGRPDPRGRGFSPLGARAQESLREGRMDRVPAEYRDLVSQYYKALSERAGR